MAIYSQKTLLNIAVKNVLKTKLLLLYQIIHLSSHVKFANHQALSMQVPKHASQIVCSLIQPKLFASNLLMNVLDISQLIERNVILLVD
jgi:hypothetical protein